MNTTSTEPSGGFTSMGGAPPPPNEEARAAANGTGSQMDLEEYLQHLDHTATGSKTQADEAETEATDGSDDGTAEQVRRLQDDLEIIGARELLALELPEQQWAVRGFIPVGLTVIAGAPKIGKSWAALQLAIAVAGGQTALGRFDTVQGDVLCLALEDNRRRGQARLNHLLDGQECPVPLDLVFRWKHLDDGGLENLTAWLELHPEARMVVIDTAQRIKPRAAGRANAYEHDYAVFAEVQQVAMRFGVAIVVLHHLRKMSAAQEGGDILEKVNGSTGITAAADAILIMDRKRCEPTGTLFLTGRDVDEAKYEAEFDAELAVWTVKGFASSRRPSDRRLAVIAAIQRAGRPLTVAEIAMATGRSEDTTRKLLTRMSGDGDIRRVPDAEAVKYAAIGMIN